VVLRQQIGGHRRSIAMNVCASLLPPKPLIVPPIPTQPIFALSLISIENTIKILAARGIRVVVSYR